jgi:hypothetical protein
LIVTTHGASPMMSKVGSPGWYACRSNPVIDAGLSTYPHWSLARNYRKKGRLLIK